MHLVVARQGCNLIISVSCNALSTCCLELYWMPHGP